MLPPAARMTRSVDFDVAVRRGRRAGRSRLVAHACLRPELNDPPLVGFVVSRSVGGSVVRHRVQRRLRHLVRERLGRLAPGTLLVIRALPPSATAAGSDLAVDLDAVFGRLGLDAP